MATTLFATVLESQVMGDARKERKETGGLETGGEAPEYKSQAGLRKESPHHPHRQRLIGKFRFNIQSTFYN